MRLHNKSVISSVIYKVKQFLLLPILLLCAALVKAQQDVSFAHYWAMEPSFNPAAVGKENKINAAGAYALQMAGFEHNPKTMYFAGDMPFYAFGQRHGVGLQLINDDIGLFSHKRVGIQYAFKKSLFGGTLSLGLQASLLSESFKGSELDLNDTSDQLFTKADITGTGIDFSAGLYYQHGAWYVGVSALHVTSPTVEMGERNEFLISPTYYLTGGYNIQLRNPFLSIQTSVLGRTDGVAWRADVTGRLKYTHEKRVMYAGLSVSPTNSVTVIVGGNIHGVHLGYSYEIYTSAISPGNGSHELFVGYQTELNFVKKGRNLHKSVRIL